MGWRSDQLAVPKEALDPLPLKASMK
jgi:hypothetical protein